MTDNGQAVTRRTITPELLTPRDHLRAKATLGPILQELGVESTYHAIEVEEIAVPFTIWCLKTRTDPDFTWDQALDTQYLLPQEIGESGPPQIAAPPAGGASSDDSGSPKKATASGPAKSSATSTA